MQENSAYKKFRRSSLKFERELRILFKDVMASGEDMFAPSCTQPQTQEAANEDVYRPTMDEEEGSGDSEDDHFGANPVGSTGVTDELASIGLSTMTPLLILLIREAMARGRQMSVLAGGRSRKCQLQDK